MFLGRFALLQVLVGIAIHGSLRLISDTQGHNLREWHKPIRTKLSSHAIQFLELVSSGLGSGGRRGRELLLLLLLVTSRLLLATLDPTRKVILTQDVLFLLAEGLSPANTLAACLFQLLDLGFERKNRVTQARQLQRPCSGLLGGRGPVAIPVVSLCPGSGATSSSQAPVGDGRGARGAGGASDGQASLGCDFVPSLHVELRMLLLVGSECEHHGFVHMVVVERVGTAWLLALLVLIALLVLVTLAGHVGQSAMPMALTSNEPRRATMEASVAM
ncbi:uncharacterized protein PG986_003609 [Apiospora aurea]|uniref:Secreted protein n=1 Tax=Apiospora aurea TaxID=335848 RepID=A0ABR1QS55_9PEZI